MALADMDFAEGNLTDGRQLLEKLIRADSSPEHVRTAKIALAQMYLSQRNFDPAETLGERCSPRRSSQRPRAEAPRVDPPGTRAAWTLPLPICLTLSTINRARLI